MTHTPPTLKNLCAVIVTYHPDNNFSNRLNILLGQIKHVVIVDNCSDSKSQEILNKLMAQGQAQVILNQDNLGIAAALNQGINWARKQGFQWVLTLDQDSCLENSAVDTFIKIYNRFENKEKIAMVGLNHIDTHSRQLYYRSRRKSRREWIERKTLITSGSFMSLQVFADLGPFREDLFIDGVDHEYCLRARRKGYQNILILNPLLKHAMGHREIIQSPLIRWMNLPMSNYSAFRWYFMVRNRLIICGEYLRFDFSWSISRFLRLIGSMTIMIFFERDRMDKIKFIALGFVDGVMRNMDRTMTAEESSIVPACDTPDMQDGIASDGATVEILMATYNGEKYIKEQIDSIVSQTYKNWVLMIQDDGSSDKTIDIIKEYEKKYPAQIKLLVSEHLRLGACMRFQELLTCSSADYIMLCDQDDVWLSNKIDLSLRKMQRLEGRYGRHSPLLVFTNLTLVDEKLNTIWDSFWDYQKINPNHTSLNYLLVENVVTGCTVIINRALTDIAKIIPPDAAMHDWWIALTASVFGFIDYIKDPMVLYRQHGQNAAGVQQWNFGEAIKLSCGGKKALIRIQKALKRHQIQAAAFYRTYKNLSNDKNNILSLAKRYSELHQMNLFQKKYFLIRHKIFCEDFARTLGYVLFC